MATVISFYANARRQERARRHHLEYHYSMSASFKWPIMGRWWNLFVCWLTSLGKYRETDSSIRLVLCYCTQADATEPALRSDPHQENRFRTFLELRCLSPGVRAMGRHLYTWQQVFWDIFIVVIQSLTLIPVLRSCELYAFRGRGK